MSSAYILSLDQGTTGTTVLLFAVSDVAAPELIAKGYQSIKQFYPRPGWVEHDLSDIWQSVRTACVAALQEAKAKDNAFHVNKILAVGITNQRETLCVLSRKTNEPLHKAIVWQCKRSADICSRLSAHARTISERTGLVVDPYFTGSKIAWLIENEPAIKKQVFDGGALCGTIDSFLLNRMTGGRSFFTEASNASRTLLFDIRKGRYDDDLLRMFGLKDSACLPEVKDSAGLFGKTHGLDFLPDGIPITGMLGDQQAALAGQACFQKGEAKCTYGTGAFLLTNTGSQALASQSGQLTTIAWQLGKKITYALEGAAFIAGAAVQFIRDELHMIATSEESERLASSATASPDLYFVPALSGLGSPHWEPHARGAIVGITRGTTKANLVRACLEGIAFQISDLLESVHRDFPEFGNEIRVDGGASANNLLMQMQADYSGLIVDRPALIETTAAGAAFFAALGAGVFKDLKQVAALRRTAKRFSPKASQELNMKKEGWQWAVKSVQTFAKFRAGLQA
ncbi:MAG: FGGY family carbohydrate kinase [Oligoflexales bacterium]